MVQELSRPVCAWPTEYEGVANSFGFATHNARSRQATAAAGAVLVPPDAAPVVVQVVPPHRFFPYPGKVNVAYIAWEANEIPDLHVKRLADADVIVVPATFLARAYASRLPGKRIEVVPLGVDADKFTCVDRMQSKYRPSPRRQFRFLWVGAPNARKGINHVLEAWRAFSEGPGARMLQKTELYIKTSLPNDAKTAHGIRREGNIVLDDRRVPLEELVGIYHRAHAFVFPSIGEGFGLTLAEAMSTGLSPIYTPATAMVDVCPPALDLGWPIDFTWDAANWSWDNADAHGTAMSVHVKVANADPFSIASAMLEAYGNPAATFAKGRKAADFIRRTFTWQRTGREMVQIIQSVQ